MTIHGMNQEEIFKELENRIRHDTEHFKGELPEKYSMAWHGYIAGLYEWEVITLKHYGNLVSILPKTEGDDPIAEIFSGRDEDDE
jgi:hypothetical protein